MKKINVFTPKYKVDECLSEIRECLECGWTGLGFKTIEFENKWKDYTKLKNAHFLNSSTAGLHLAVKIYKEQLGWNDDDEIITTPLTFISTNHVILYERLKPVFADIDDTLCLCPDSIEKKITSKTRAVMYVGMGGNAGNLDKVIELCRKNNLKLILDAAHMAGTYYKEKHIGHDIDVTVFSFHAVKNLPTSDSGMICFKEKKFDDMVRKYSWLGINQDTFLRSGEKKYKWDYDVEYVGLKAHGNSIAAALGLVQLKYLDEDNKKRLDLVCRYKQRLTDINGIKYIKFFHDCESSNLLFQIRVHQDKRDILIDYLNDNNIFPGVHYKVNTDYKMYDYAKGTCPNAETVSKELISLPVHVNLEMDDIDYICDNIVDFKGF